MRYYDDTYWGKQDRERSFPPGPVDRQVFALRWRRVCEGCTCSTRIDDAEKKRNSSWAVNERCRGMVASRHESDGLWGEVLTSVSPYPLRRNDAK